MSGPTLQNINLEYATSHHRLGPLNFDNVRSINSAIGNAAGIVTHQGEDILGQLGGIYRKGSEVFIIVDDRAINREDIKTFRYDTISQFKPEGNYSESDLLKEANLDSPIFEKNLANLIKERFDFVPILEKDFPQMHANVNLGNSYFAPASDVTLDEIKDFYYNDILPKEAEMEIVTNRARYQTSTLDFDESKNAILINTEDEKISIPVKDINDYVRLQR